MAFVTSTSLPVHSTFSTRPRVSRRSRSTHQSRPALSMRVIDPLPTSESIYRSLTRPVRIALTREDGKNLPLYHALNEVYPDLEIIEIPCVETTKSTHSDYLTQFLQEKQTTWIIITSPEAAKVFIDAWRKADYPKISKIAAVGKATASVLQAVGLYVSFAPTKATGKTLVKEIPVPEGEGETVLYPASAKASDVVETGLTEKGYTVTRLNTYSTETVVFGKEEMVLAKGTHIITFASPSAVKGWVKNTGLGNHLVSCACIGETSATAAREAGFKQVHYPDRPGMEGWISAVSEALKIYEGIEL